MLDATQGRGLPGQSGLGSLRAGHADLGQRQRLRSARSAGGRSSPAAWPTSRLRPEQMVVVDLDGNVVEGDLRPSTDTPTHLWLYRHFERIGGIAHTHSRQATMFAQARREIPCLGTTHADHFFGPVPVTRPLTQQEVDDGLRGATPGG